MPLVTAVAASTADWEFEAGSLPDLRVGYHDGLIVGLLPEPLDPSSDSQDLLLCDVMDVAPDVMVGASLGVVQLSTVGLVMVHLRYTPVVRSQVAWAVGIRLRRQRLLAGADPRVVVTGVRPSADLMPPGVRLVTYSVLLRDRDTASLIEVWEVEFPSWIVAGEPLPS
ncbi:conserved hypothetical protein [Frankia sp. Hr75.2]|nr:conserved hypothetical protein [Frankia sp. Hr75.2]